MSIEDTIGYRRRIPACVVCGKNVAHGGGFARVPRGEMVLELCCPLCLETFQKDPTPYLRIVQRIEYFRELAELQEAAGTNPSAPAERPKQIEQQSAPTHVVNPLPWSLPAHAGK